MGIARVIGHAGRPKIADALVGTWRNPRHVGAVPKTNHGSGLGGPQHCTPEVCPIRDSSISIARSLTRADVAQSLCKSRHAGGGKRIHCKPVSPIAVVLEVAGGQKAIFGRLAAMVENFGQFSLLNNPIGGAHHAWCILPKPRLVSREEIMLRERPKHRSLVQIIR